MPQPEQVKPWLDFLSTFIWQVMIVATVVYFRKPIVALFYRLAKVKFGGTELIFIQPPSSEAVSLSSKAVTKLEIVDTTGFFTEAGIKGLISNSGLVRNDEKVKRALLIFKTDRQRTWFVSTNRQLFCVLDDEDTRASRSLIQWKVEFNEAKPIIARHYKPSVGLINVGKFTSWLYSEELHPSPTELDADIRSMVSE
jgi:hypothetical protein